MAVEYVPRFDEVLQPGDRIQIWYEPSDPSRQIYDRKTYTRVFRVVFGMGLFVAGCLLGLLLLGDYRAVAKLKRHDASLNKLT